MAKCPAKRVTCNYCRNTRQYERTGRGRQASNRWPGAVNIIQDHLEGTFDYSEILENHLSQHGSSVGWVSRSEASPRFWGSDSSGFFW